MTSFCYTVYQITCRKSGIVCYIGCTNNVARRILRHWSTKYPRHKYKFKGLIKGLSQAKALRIESYYILEHSTTVNNKVGEHYRAKGQSARWQFNQLLEEMEEYFDRKKV